MNQSTRWAKQDIYRKYNFNLIELNETDVQNLDDILPPSYSNSASSRIDG